MKNIISRYKYSVNSIIKKMTGDFDEDLEQEVYIRAWKNSIKYQEQNKFKQWINTITANICRDYLKSKDFKNRTNFTDMSEFLENTQDNKQTPEDKLDSRTRQKIILAAINKLPKKLKQVVILYELEEYSYDEISKKEKVPVGTIKSRLFNARKILSQQLSFLIGD